jgi:hypothetical protein
MINYTPDTVFESSLLVPIYTAGANQAPEISIAKGTIKLGNLNLDVLQVPTFAKNPLSATQLSIDHGCKHVIEPWTAKLTIINHNTTIATGTYDPSTKLIKIDSENAFKAVTNDDWTTVNRKLGHVGSNMMKQTLKATTAIQLKNSFEVLTCEYCLTSKRKRAAISSGNHGNEKDILEVIELDAQGPFPVVASDGTTSNLKLIDVKSGWGILQQTPF